MRGSSWDKSWFGNFTEFDWADAYVAQPEANTVSGVVDIQVQAEWIADHLRHWASDILGAEEERRPELLQMIGSNLKANVSYRLAWHQAHQDDKAARQWRAAAGARGVATGATVAPPQWAIVAGGRSLVKLVNPRPCHQACHLLRPNVSMTWARLQSIGWPYLCQAVLVIH